MAVSPASAQQFEIKPIAEKKIPQLPPGQLFWRIDTFPTLAQAQTAASPTALAAEAAGKVWLFTLGPKGGSSPGGTKIAEIGPVPPVSAPEYLLRINITGGPPGVKTPVHTHPGSETFYVLAGELSQKTPHGMSHDRRRGGIGLGHNRFRLHKDVAKIFRAKRRGAGEQLFAEVERRQFRANACRRSRCRPSSFLLRHCGA
jgi:hypothetical protein